MGAYQTSEEVLTMVKMRKTNLKYHGSRAGKKIDFIHFNALKYKDKAPFVRLPNSRVFEILLLTILKLHNQHPLPNYPNLQPKYHIAFSLNY